MENVPCKPMAHPFRITSGALLLLLSIQQASANISYENVPELGVYQDGVIAGYGEKDQTMELMNNSNEVLAKTNCDEKGRYEFTDLKIGDLTTDGYRVFDQKKQCHSEPVKLTQQEPYRYLGKFACEQSKASDEPLSKVNRHGKKFAKGGKGFGKKRVARKNKRGFAFNNERGLMGFNKAHHLGNSRQRKTQSTSYHNVWMSGGGDNGSYMNRFNPYQKKLSWNPYYSSPTYNSSYTSGYNGAYASPYGKPYPAKPSNKHRPAYPYYAGAYPAPQQQLPPIIIVVNQTTTTKTELPAEAKKSIANKTPTPSPAALSRVPRLVPLSVNRNAFYPQQTQVFNPTFNPTFNPVVSVQANPTNVNSNTSSNNNNNSNQNSASNSNSNSNSNESSSNKSASPAKPSLRSRFGSRFGSFGGGAISKLRGLLR